ncbi:MAG TPA: hypothetical protein VL860_12385, partial [Planctomycetota bacterium]|nr:hypothetical protein [Planctomycetota bacterium]
TRRLFRMPENSAIAPAIQLPSQRPSPSAAAPSTAAPQRPKTVAQAPTHPGGGAANAPTTVRRGTTGKQLPVAGAKPSTGKTRSKQAPVAPPPPLAATSTAVIEEPVHAPDLTPAFGQSELALESELRAKLEGTLIRLRAMDDVYAAWMMLPIAAWGGLTVAGALWNGNLPGAILVAVLTAAGAVLPYLFGGRFRKYAAGISILCSLCGWWVLEQVGQVLIPATRHVFKGPAETTTVNDWLQVLVVGLLALLSLVSIGHAALFYWHEWRKQKTLAKLELEVKRLEAISHKKT